MVYINKDTLEIVRHLLCDEAREEYFECDELIAPTIQMLNVKGYLTNNCCSGHPTYNVAITENGSINKIPYEPMIWISFDEKVDISNWKLPTSLNYSIELSGYGQYQLKIYLPIVDTDDFFDRATEIIKYCKLFHNWAVGLPPYLEPTGELIGVGTTRRVIDIGNGLVMKLHNHIIGYRQSLNEYAFYNSLPTELRLNFNEPIGVTAQFQMCRRIEPNTSYSESSYDVSMIDDDYLPYQLYPTANGHKDFSPNAEQIRELLREFGIIEYELDSTSNFGIVDNQRVFIDYGMTTALRVDFERAVASGEVPYFTEEYCKHCEKDTRFESYSGQPNDFCVCCGNMLR